MSPGVFLLLGLLILRAEPSITPEKGGDPQKLGRCPRDFMRCLRQEPPLCANDSSCPAGLKCCPWECRLRCIPPAEEKPGACLAAAPEGFIAPCSFPCLEDKDCLGMQKCCPLGCGSACVEPAPDKPGECPKVRPQQKSEPCTEQDSCAHDRDCPRQEKCCFSGCAMHCARPAREHNAVAVPRHRAEQCVEKCEADSQCPWGQRCTRTSCGRVCTDTPGDAA
ncbi:hypothetical protein WISP_90850 [Willisornis vidua]|uniref:WAP domain-containing protein n=1 Tax=Willisornis vidua TaxID=1566151 RepID=A0ABQ9D1L0_9PASS|nr:hypothetical protein WISP_90850 [Willisornis vidua]